jgi:SAM-dependent methyltransferase
MSKSQEEFYQAWSVRSDAEIAYYNEAAVRKMDAVLDGMPVVRNLAIRSTLDFGCGYGQVLSTFAERLGLDRAFGFDYSGAAVEDASRRFRRNGMSFHRLTSLDIDKNVEAIRTVVGEKVDCILLVDLLEHIPDCKRLLLKLSELTTYFLVKLPIEENVLDNYIFRKAYPSTKQANGHLREFNANTVHYFIRTIGLTPLAEGIHVYDFRDSYPPLTAPLAPHQAVIRSVVKVFRMTTSFVLSRKIYIRLFGPGSYYCIATFNKDHILNP